MLNLPEFSPDRVRRTLAYWAALVAMLLVAYTIYRHQTVRPSEEMKTGLKALTDPESLVKDL